ncbi:hypothetical protein V6N00_13825 [Tersicoccus sp. MR15.9]|uniref:hypothetical protein n=1 Tax=Tersicoccus mangrovi TaxID=3121635 RepID=UPI002FE52D9B
MYRTVTSRRDADDLSSVLTDPLRERAVVVVSVNGDEVAFFDPERVAREVGSGAQVYLLATRAVAYDFGELMPADANVYGGAARVYPPGADWLADLHRAPLHFAFSVAEAMGKLARIGEDVAAMAYRPSTVPGPTRAAPPVPQEHGVVSAGLGSDGVLVTLQDGRTVQVRVPATDAGIDLSSVLPVGAVVSGAVFENTMDVDGLHTAADVVDAVTENMTVPALVASEKSVLLFPGLTVRHRVPAAPGTVIAVRVDLVGRADGKGWSVSTVTDPHPDEVSPALPLLEGGQPWITWPPSTEPPAPDVQASTTLRQTADSSRDPHQDERGEAGPGLLEDLEGVRDRIQQLLAENERLGRENTHLTDTVQTLSEEIDDLLAAPSAAAVVPDPVQDPQVAGLKVRLAAQLRRTRELEDERDEAVADAVREADRADRVGRENDRLRAELRAERAKATAARRASRSADAAPTGPAFTDPQHQFRHEVYLAWVDRFPAAAKDEHPMAGFDLGERFLPDLEALQGIDRSKVVDVVVEILTGLADRLPGREMHRLRGGVAGAPTIEDPVLGTAWRVSLQVKTASARRLHFWRGYDGHITLATVGVHDDLEI